MASPENIERRPLPPAKGEESDVLEDERESLESFNPSDERSSRGDSLPFLAHDFLELEALKCAGRELIPDKTDFPDDGRFWLLLVVIDAVSAE